MDSPAASALSNPSFEQRLCSTQYSIDDMSLFDSGQALVKSFERKCKTAMVDAELMKDCCVQVTNMHRVSDDVIAKLIGLPVGHPAFDSAPGHPNAEATRVMVATIVGSRQFALAISRSTELATKYDESFVEHPTLLEIG